MMFMKIDKLIPLRYKKILKKFFSTAVPYWRTIKRNCDPRKWSDDELRKLAPYFFGNIINIEGRW